jgi:hypothetical protein
MSLRLSPDARWFALAEQLHVDHVRVAANRAVLDVLLLISLGEVNGDDDTLAAGRADVRPFIRGATASELAAFHPGQLTLTMVTGAVKLFGGDHTPGSGRAWRGDRNRSGGRDRPPPDDADRASASTGARRSRFPGQRRP